MAWISQYTDSMKGKNMRKLSGGNSIKDDTIRCGSEKEEELEMNPQFSF